MAYRTSFIVQIVSMALSDIVMVMIFAVFFNRFHTIAGMDFQGYLRLLIVVLLGYCISHILFYGTRKIGELIVTGQLDMHLLLPRNLLIRVMTSRLQVSVFGDLIYAIGLFFLIKGVTLIFVLKAIFVATFGWLTFMGFALTIESLWFRIGSSRELSRAIFEAVMWPAHYPPNIFSTWIFKVLFMSVLPVFFVAYLPYNMLSFGFSRANVSLLIGASIFFCSLWAFTFYRWLRKYESGNLMNVNE